MAENRTDEEVEVLRARFEESARRQTDDEDEIAAFVAHMLAMVGAG